MKFTLYFLLYYVIDNNQIRSINYCACHSYVKYKCCRPIRTPRISVRSYSIPKLRDQGVRMLRWRSEAQFIKISMRPTNTINDSGMGCLSHFILAQRIGLPSGKYSEYMQLPSQYSAVYEKQKYNLVLHNVMVAL